MYIINSINLKNNTRINATFKNALGVEDMTNLSIKAIKVIIDIESKEWIIGYRFIGDNLNAYREFTYKPADLSKGEKTWLLDIMSKSELKGLTEPEFAGATKI